MLKEQKGITLVALVLLIVILLIIAGVSIAAYVGNGDNVSKTTKNSAQNTFGNSDKENAETIVKLVFEVLEANYETELAKGNLTSRAEMFTAEKISTKLAEYDISGNTKTTLGNVNITSGVKINYNNKFTFTVSVDDFGDVKIISK